MRQVHWRQGHRNECGLALTSSVEDKSVLREKECPICLCDWEDVQPVQLPCSHTLCCHCLQELRESDIRHACPLCRADLPSDGDKLYADAMTLCIRAAAGTNDKFKQRLWYRTAELLEASIAHGHDFSLIKLASMYQDGAGVAQNTERAMVLLNQAITCDEPGIRAPAMNNLGVIYFNGELIDQDQDRAAELYRRAVDVFKVTAGGPVQKCPDFAQAYENLAVCYDGGFGVSADIRKAQELNEAAIACGSSTAGYNLGHQLYEDGPFQDRARAVEVWQECFENGQIDAAFDIGLC